MTKIRDVREKQLEEKSTLLLNVQNELNSSLEESKHLKKVITENNETISSLTSDLEEMKKENNRLKHVEEDLKDAQLKVSELMAEGSQLAKKQGTNEGTIRSLRAKVKSLTEEVQELRTKTEEDQKVIGEYEEKISALYMWRI